MRLLVLLTSLVLPVATVAAENDLLPRPTPVQTRVAFWVRIYSEVGTDGGLLHDSSHLDVVYDVMRFPGLSDRARERRVKEAREETASILRRLAHGKRDGLSADEARVLAAWPDGVSDATLREAAHRVRFQRGQADKFRAGVARAGAWEDYIHHVLDEHGVPPELAALPHVESSFDPDAHSHAGAAGIWQFMRSTGRRFMTVDWVMDERRDPLLATVAAARLLRENYEATQTWPLAITAYNHGAAGMNRAVRTLGTRDIGVIVERYRSRTFGFASQNFYAEFLAALDVSRDAGRYFGPVERHTPFDPEIVVLDAHYPAAVLSDAFGVPLDDLRRYNRALLSPVWDGRKHVPARYGLRLPRDGTRPPGRVVLASIPDTRRYAEQKGDRFHRVRPGDTISTIARRYGVSQWELVSANGLRNRHRIRIGQVLRLPVRDVPISLAVAREERPADGIYRVRRGDTLSRIARRFGVSEQDLAAQNRLTNRNSLQVGQVLQLPGGRVVPTSGDYTVRPGDTLTDIARRHGVSVQEILALNRLMNRNQLRVGQTLRLPVRGDAGKDVVADVPKNAAPEVEPEVAEAPAPAESEVAGAAEPVKPEVAEVPNYAAPEVEPEVADAAEPAEPEVAEVPKNAAPEVKPEVADATEPAEPEPAPASATPEPTLADAGQPAPTVESGESRPDAARLALVDDGSLRVAPEETLGHYADWLEIPTQRLRDLNRLRFGAALTLGQRIRLDFAHVSRREFEHRRLAFHQGLHQRFFRENRVTGTEEYVLERGDTLWVLSQRKLAVPVWLLTAYNPDVDFGAPLRPGQRLRVPRVEPSS